MLNVEIISVEGILFQGEAFEVVVPISSGEIGFMENHESVVAELQEGEVKILDRGENILQKFAVKSGSVSMHEGKKLSVLVDEASV